MLLRLQNASASMTEMARHQERLANNLANANTAGFKRDRVFIEALNEQLDAEGAPRSDRNPVQWADLEQGPLERTGNPLDVALGGNGFLNVTDNDGNELYTRAGRLVVGPDQTLQTPSGLTVQGEGGPIQMPPDAQEISIASSGQIRADGRPLGRLRVVRFEDPTQLERRAGATFAAAEGAVPEEVEQPQVLQGHIEESNVNPVEAMTDMIEHFRMFESQQKMIRSSDQLLGQVARDLGRF